ncbi:MAG: cobalamin-dependent protein [Deltaproteobacteria bacterium]|nr:cobalamin-dependent protein [Deltaproteobacteria bacterium]MBW2303542.1 cobalamin-dependent protein [Deltaproteobacteria bacterium]
MKVLLISPNIESLPDPVFPIGVACIAGALKERGITFRILDLCFVQDFEKALEDELTSYPPDLIGLSIRNLDNVSWPHYVSYVPFYRRVVESVRRYTRAPIFLGGSGFSLMPGKVLEVLGADGGIIGEGERAFTRLVQGIQEAGKWPLEPEKRILSPGPIQDLDALPLPDRSGFDNEAYLMKGGMGNIQTKRGCPFRCIYCTYPLIEGTRMRLRSPSRVCDEIADLLDQGIDNLFVVDSAFNYPPEHAEAVCREMVRRKLPVRWSCYLNPAFVTPRLMELMGEAGCSGVEFGTDAAHPEMLRNLGKGFGMEDVRRASEICRHSGMPFCHSLLLGGPGENLDTARRSLETVRTMEPTAVICMVGIRVFPGTRLARLGEREGIPDPASDLLNPVFYLAPGLEEEILSLVEEFSRDNPTWIFPGLNINMNHDLQRKLRRFGLKGPLWEYMARGRRRLPTGSPRNEG